MRTQNFFRDFFSKFVQLDFGCIFTVFNSSLQFCYGVFQRFPWNANDPRQKQITFFRHPEDSGKWISQLSIRSMQQRFEEIAYQHPYSRTTSIFCVCQKHWSWSETWFVPNGTLRCSDNDWRRECKRIRCKFRSTWFNISTCAYWNRNRKLADQNPRSSIWVFSSVCV